MIELVTEFELLNSWFLSIKFFNFRCQLKIVFVTLYLNSYVKAEVRRLAEQCRQENVKSLINARDPHNTCKTCHSRCNNIVKVTLTALRWRHSKHLAFHNSHSPSTHVLVKYILIAILRPCQRRNSVSIESAFWFLSSV